MVNVPLAERRILASAWSEGEPSEGFEQRRGLTQLTF